MSNLKLRDLLWGGLFAFAWLFIILAMAALFGMFAVVLVLLNICLGMWVARDAGARGKDPYYWPLVVILFGAVSLIIWLAVRPRTVVLEAPVSTAEFEEMCEDLAELRTRQYEQKRGPFKTDAEREKFKEKQRKAAISQFKSFTVTKMGPTFATTMRAKAEKMRAGLKKALEERERVEQEG